MKLELAGRRWEGTECFPAFSSHSTQMTTLIPLTLKIPDSLTHARETHWNSNEAGKSIATNPILLNKLRSPGPLIHGYLDPITWWLSF